MQLQTFNIYMQLQNKINFCNYQNLAQKAKVFLASLLNNIFIILLIKLIEIAQKKSHQRKVLNSPTFLINIVINLNLYISSS